MNVRPLFQRSIARRRGAVLAAVVLLATAATFGPAVTRADAIQFGGNSGARPNVNFGCEAGFALADQFGNYGVFATGAPSCSYFQTTPLGQRSGAAPATRGRVTLVRVRTGDDPAPLRFTVIQARSGVDANGNLIPGSTQCCFGDQMTGTFRLRPNRVNVIPLNLPMLNGKNVSQGLAITDYVGFSATSGTGTIPIRVTSNPPNSDQSSDPNNPGVRTYYPQIRPGEVRNPGFLTPSIRLTTEFTFCTLSGPRPGRVAPSAKAGSNGTCGGNIRTSSAQSRNGKVTIPISCVGSCKGKIGVKRIRGNAKLGVTRSFQLRTGGKGKVTVNLTRAGKLATRGKKSIRAKVLLRTQGSRETRVVRIK